MSAAQADEAAIRAAIEAHDKCISTLKARCALAGFTLFVTNGRGGGSAFFVQRWDRSRELADAGAVEAFLQQIGAA